MFPRDCAELIKALGSFDYACANKHLMRISKHLYQMYSDLTSDVEREISIYRDTVVGVYGSADTLEPSPPQLQPSSSSRSAGSRQQGVGTGFGPTTATSGQSSPITNMSEASQPSIHQYISINQVSGNQGSNNNNNNNNSSSNYHYSTSNNSNSNNNNGNIHNARAAENIPNPGLSLSPTYSGLHFHHQGERSYHGGKEEQSAADHVVLYTILRELCNIRMALIGIYRTLSLSTVEIDTDTLIAETEQALQLFDSGTLEIQSSVLGRGIGCEIQVLKHTLLMHKAVCEYDIQKSATNLHLALVALSEWRRISTEQEYADKSVHRPEETSWRLTFFGVGSNSNNIATSNSGGGSDEKNTSSSSSGGAGGGGAGSKGKFNLQPNHLQWLGRWIASEKSKMTIYFMDILLEKEQAMGGDERSLWANTEPDMHGMIRAFRKKAGAQSISFVYEISHGVRFSTLGLVSANAPYEAPTGLNSFPCIYSYPPDPPRDHWPNIISIMQGSMHILRQFRSQYFYDRKIGCTYYVARIDKHVSIVIIYLDKHPQPDTGAMDFLQLLASKLRHSEVLSAMRVE
ncbi:hypothetical protein BGZ58_006477 [Dissophora ornata]|nr:hypothetical protein BGZ58_006477 [Dissophora ornata]